MSKREIILADSDCVGRKQLADSLNAAGYSVETTDSTSHVLCSVLEKQIPVVLLGSGCDKKIAMANLVPLLKKCNRKVTIILVSDEEPLPTIRTVRQEGIFYHALKPTGRDETEELLTAVECALSKAERDERKLEPRSPVKQESLDDAAMPCEADHETKQDLEELPLSMKVDTIRESIQKEKETSAKATTSLTALIAATIGFAYYIVAPTKWLKESGDLVMWGFFGFCALIVVGQLLPLFFSLRAARKVIEQRVQGVKEEGQQVFAELDKNK